MTLIAELAGGLLPLAGTLKLELEDSVNSLSGYSTVSAITSHINGLQQWTEIQGKPNTLSGYGITDAATAAQGALADSAVQPADLAVVATTGAYADLTGKPTLGTLAALSEVSNAQVATGAAIAWSKIDKTGAVAADVGAAATSHNQAWSTITSRPTTLSGYGITDAQALDADLTAIAALAGTGTLERTGTNTWATYPVTAFAKTLLDDIDAAAFKATLGLAAVASSGAYGDLSGKPYTPWTNVSGYATIGAQYATEVIALNTGGTNPDRAIYQHATNNGMRFEAVGTFLAQRSDVISGYFGRVGSDGPTVELAKNGAIVGSISVSASGTSYNTTSDRRLKMGPGGAAEIPEYDPANIIAALPLIKVREFEFKAVPGQRHIGFIADELQQFCPWAVVGDPDAVDANGNPIWQQIDPSKMVAPLVAACKYLYAHSQALEARVAALEALNG